VNLLGGIGYTVNVTGSGSDTLVVNGTNTNNTYNITSTRISLVNEVIKYSGIQTSILNAGGGSDTVNIQSIANNTTINLSDTTNTINVGSNAPTESGGNMASIKATLTVNGAKLGINTVNVDDSSDNSSNTTSAAVILTASDLSGSIFGANGSLAYAAVGTLNIYLGNGAHIVDIQGMAGAVNVTLGNGINVLNIGSNAGPIVTDANLADANTTLGNSTNTGSTLDQISGVLTFTGTGANTLNLDDSGSNAGVDGALTPTTITFLNTTTLADQFVINLPTMAAINIALSQGGDIFAVGDTFTSASTNPVIVIDGNGGNDTFVILDTHAVMTINGGSGADQFYNFGNSSVLDLNGDAGDDTFYIYASVNENTSNLDKTPQSILTAERDTTRFISLAPNITM
jgi:acrosin